MRLMTSSFPCNLSSIFPFVLLCSSHHKYNGDLVFLFLKPECFSQYTFSNFNNGKDYRVGHL